MEMNQMYMVKRLQNEVVTLQESGSVSRNAHSESAGEIGSRTMAQAESKESNESTEKVITLTLKGN